MQWYYVIPGTPTSAPTLIGDYLFFNMNPTLTPVGGGATFSGTNCVVAVDAAPAANDAAVRLGFGEPILHLEKHIHWIAPMVDLNAGGPTVVSYSPPVGDNKILANSSTIGAFAYNDEPTLIADGQRLIEVGPDGAASWTLSSTQLTNIQGGDLPIYGPTGQILNKDPSTGDPPTGRATSVTQTLSHPSIARRITSGDYLIADSGNNRVVRADRGGSLNWELKKFADPYKIAAGSDPITLSGPTDVQYYTAPSPSNGYEVHYLVADPGNFRIIEVADYFDSHGVQIDSPYTHTGNVSNAHSLVWITRTQSTQGQRLTYTNIQRYLGTDPTNTYSGYPYVIATVGNSSVGGSSSSGGADFTGGALVSLNYAPYSTALPINALTGGAQSITTIWPNAGVTPPTNEPIANGTILASANDLRETIGSQTFGTAGSITPTASSPTGFNIRKLTHPAYFTELNLPNITAGAASFRTIYLICDSSTVYAIEATTDTAGNAVRDVLWKFTQADYDTLNEIRLGIVPTDLSVLPRFVPSSAKLLPNGNFLITNSFFGRSPLFKSGQFNGEVIEITPGIVSGTGFTTPFSLYTANSSTTTVEGGLYIAGEFAAPTIKAVTTGGTTYFVQSMGATGNTSLLEQPLFSDRQ